MLTAFYMTRQVIMVFFGEAKWESYANADEAPDGEEEFASTAHGEFKPHESPPIMLFPLVVLAGLAIFGGIIQLPSFGLIPSAARHRLEDFLHPVVEFAEAEITDTSIYDAKVLLALLAIVCAVARDRRRRRDLRQAQAKPFEPEILADGWGYDRAISVSWVVPGRKAFEAIAWFDKNDHRRRRQRCRATASPRVPVSSAGARPATCATTRPSSALGVVLLLAWFVIGRGVL